MTGRRRSGCLVNQAVGRSCASDRSWRSGSGSASSASFQRSSTARCSSVMHSSGTGGPLISDGSIPRRDHSFTRSDQGLSTSGPMASSGTPEFGQRIPALQSLFEGLRTCPGPALPRPRGRRDRRSARCPCPGYRIARRSGTRTSARSRVSRRDFRTASSMSSAGSSRSPRQAPRRDTPVDRRARLPARGACSDTRVRRCRTAPCQSAVQALACCSSFRCAIHWASNQDVSTSGRRS